MLTVTTTSNFVSPSAQSALSGNEGLTVSEIAQSLNRRFQEVKELVETNKEFLDQVEISTFYNSNGLEVQSYVLSVDDAKFIVARSNTTEGKLYTKWLIQQEKKATQLDTLLSDPANAVLVFQRLADTKRALQEATALVSYSQQALTSSQVNTSAQTRKVHALEAELRQLNRMVSMSQYLILRRPELKVDPKKLTQAVRELVQAQGHTPVQQTLPGDKWPSWTFKISWLDSNCDRITQLALQSSVTVLRPVRQLPRQMPAS